MLELFTWTFALTFALLAFLFLSAKSPVTGDAPASSVEIAAVWALMVVCSVSFLAIAGILISRAFG